MITSGNASGEKASTWANKSERFAKMFREFKDRAGWSRHVYVSERLRLAPPCEGLDGESCAATKH